MSPVYIGQHPPDYRVDEPVRSPAVVEDVPASINREILGALSTWRVNSGPPRPVLWSTDLRSDGVTTNSLARRLHIAAYSPERQAMQDALTQLRRAKLVHYELDKQVDTAAKWWITTAGLATLA